MSRRLAVSPTESVCDLALAFLFFIGILPYPPSIEEGGVVDWAVVSLSYLCVILPAQRSAKLAKKGRESLVPGGATPMLLRSFRAQDLVFHLPSLHRTFGFPPLVPTDVVRSNPRGVNLIALSNVIASGAFW
jgi:hypothetical protein